MSALHLNPNNSRIGGAGLNHWKADGSETIDSFFRSGNIFWFGDSLLAIDIETTSSTINTFCWQWSHRLLYC